MKIIIKKPNEEPIEIESDPGTGYDNWRELIGGWIEQAAYNESVEMYFDEEGKLKNLDLNFIHPRWGDICGPVIFAAQRRVNRGTNNEQVIPVSLSQSQIKLIMGDLQENEIATNQGQN